MTPNRWNSASPVNPYHDQGKLLVVQVLLTSRLDELLDALSVKLVKSRKMFYGPCPIHLGSNPSGLNLYLEGEDVPGYWRCNTRQCHGTFKRTILGFVRGILSQQKGWYYIDDAAARKKQPIVTWKETVDWCCGFLGQDIYSIEVDYDALEKRRFTSGAAQFTRKPEQESQGITRSQVRSWLKIPATYFVSRGYTPEILDRYDVGLYPVGDRPLSDRVAVPIYGENRLVAGFTGRSIFPQCEECKRWHDEGEACPEKDDQQAYGRTAKWYNHKFNKDSFLYNYWFAKQAIKETATAVLVEGPGCVWRLAEAGINYGLSMFGADLSDQQQVLLEMSGAMNIVVLTDNDEAGNEARAQLKQRLSRSFILHFPLLSAHDVGSLSVLQVIEQLSPTLDKITRRGF